MAANKARKWMTHSKEERANGIAKSMAKVFGKDELLDVSFWFIGLSQSSESMILPSRILFHRPRSGNIFAYPTAARIINNTD